MIICIHIYMSNNNLQLITDRNHMYRDLWEGFITVINNECCLGYNGESGNVIISQLIITMIQITRRDLMSKTDKPLSKVASKMFEDDEVEYSSPKLTEQNLGKHAAYN